MTQKQLLGLYFSEEEARTFLPIHEQNLPDTSTPLLELAPDGLWEIYVEIHYRSLLRNEESCQVEVLARR